MKFLIDILGEIYPDFIVEDKIRIIKNNKIGFANKKGDVVIKPQFEFATEFHNGFAIIAKNCKKIPWHNENEHSGCEHISVKCLNYGYINEKGEILKIGKFTFEEICNKINWESSEE